MTDKEIMQMALDWADNHGEVVFAGGGWNAVNPMNEWARLLRARLSQPEPELEPVAWQVIPDGVDAKQLTEMKAKHIIDRDGYVVGGYILESGKDICLVYHSAVRWMKFDELFQILHVTAPPQREWQGLTDEEREKATGWSVEHIEAALKAKNA